MRGCLLGKVIALHLQASARPLVTVVLCTMKLGLRLPSGVPTTPPPEKPAPSPRYNDLTRPRALQINTDPRQGRLHTSDGDGTSGGKPQLQRQQERRWSEENTEKADPGLRRSANHRGLDGSNPFSFEQEQLLQQQQQQQQYSSSSSDPDFPLPWQGNIDLPASEEETMNAAQTWIAQILHETGEDANDGDETDLSSDVLLDGRVLCRIANAIAPGIVEIILQEKSMNASNMHNFSIACRKFGVPAGALFDVEDIDPRRVGLCLHVLSRVVRDTVPGFAGPFLTLPRVLSPTPTTDGDGVANNNFAALRQWPPPHDSAATPRSDDEEGEATHQQSYEHHHHHHHHRQPRPPTPPMRPRPLSFPSRFSPATQAEDAVWNSLFPPSPSPTVGGGGGVGEIGNTGTGGDGGGRNAAAAWRATGAARTPRYEFSERAAATAAATAAELTNWLSNLSLGDFEDSLVNIGVESMGDLRYVEEQDLSAIGMHGPQIRKLLQNRP